MSDEAPRCDRCGEEYDVVTGFSEYDARAYEPGPIYEHSCRYTTPRQEHAERVWTVIVTAAALGLLILALVKGWWIFLGVVAGFIAWGLILTFIDR